MEKTVYKTILISVIIIITLSHLTEPVYAEENQIVPTYYKNSDTKWLKGYYYYSEIYLVAQLMLHEAGNQCMEGKLAIAEVVLNRVNSVEFPDSIREVVYQPKQFSYNENIKYQKPDNSLIKLASEVLNGNLRILKNPDIVSYRNTYITSGINPCEAIDWGSYKYSCYIQDHAFYTISSKEIDL